jgi:hypothetical protein
MGKPLKPKLLKIIVKNSVRSAKNTQHFIITKIKLLTLFKEIISVYTENHTKLISTECRMNVKVDGTYCNHSASKTYSGVLIKEME